MKFLRFPFVMAIILLAACQPTEEGEKELSPEEQKYQDLVNESTVRDSAMLELMTTLNLIDENISKISDRHNKIDLQAGNIENRQTYRDRMLDEIQDIYSMMESNKERINDLNSRLADTRSKLGKANKENERLTRLLDQYQVMIDNLGKKLEDKDKEIYELKEELAKMDISLDSLKVVVQTKHKALNKVYYAFGTKKELIYHNVIDKSGGVLGIGKTYQLKDNFDKTYFTEASSEDLSEIELFAKDVTILSQHREGSYHLERGEGVVEKLVIDKPSEFWEASKFLVIEVKQ